MSCVLCLELSVDSAKNIQIHSAEGQTLNIQCIIDQHFPWLKTLVENDTNNWVCCSCWQCLSSFHTFYLRVESAHKFLECDTKPVETCVFVEPQILMTLAEAEIEEKEDVLGGKEIKVEPGTAIPLTPHPKRKRGRPRKESLVTCRSIERETRSSFRRGANIANVKNQIDSIEKFAAIKDEILDEEVPCSSKFKVDDVINGTEEKSLSIVREDNATVDVFNSNSNGNGKTIKLTIKKKRTFSKIREKYKKTQLSTQRQLELTKKALVTKECDEYIAQHFRLSCCVCNEPLVDFNELKSHFRVEHQIRGYVKCCGKKLLKRGLLVDHLRTHEDPSYHKCPLCDKVLASGRYLDNHMKVHEPREYKFECEICGKKLISRPAYERHKVVHLSEEEKTVSCPTCKKRYATTAVLNEHIKTVHLKTYSKICDICGKSLVGGAAFRRHMEEHSGVPAPINQCNLCGITVVTKYGLKRHMKAMHLEENRQPQTCLYCAKVSPGIRALQNHIKYVHKAERKHACPMCVKAFKRPKELKEHITTHTGEALYTCPHCPRTFKSKANMHSHRKKAHRKEWEETRLARFNKLPQQEALTTPNENNSLTVSNLLELVP